eukprot:Em0015g1126a
MGKKQHQKDKMYLTCTEWTTIYGGRKANVKERATFRKLEFYCCSLTLQPFEHPLCTPDGNHLRSNEYCSLSEEIWT